MNATIRFWRDLLGMRLISGVGEAGFRHYFFEIDATSTIPFFEWEGAQPVARKLHGRPFSGPIAFDHVAFSLHSTDELWQLKDKLEAAGFPCSDMIDHGLIYSVYSFDPNGIAIEFCCEVAAQDIHQHLGIHDACPPPTATEGAEPQRGKWPEVTNPIPAAKRLVKTGGSSGFFQKWASR